jgi:hypothetical protein
MGTRWHLYTSVLLVAAGCGSDHTDTTSTREQSVATCVSLDATADAMLSNPPMGHNFGGMPILRVGGKDESVLRFSLASIPATAAVDRATLSLYVSGGESTQPINAHRIVIDWSETTATYAGVGQQFDSKILGAFKSSSGAYQKSMDVSGQVRQWLNSSQPNYGLLLETTSSKKTVFVSREGGTPDQRPHLEVCYTVPPTDHCADDPCENGGTCENTPDAFTCHCQPGYTGDRCQTPIDNCASNPCQNGGTCSNHTGGYTCACPAGYTGANCETLVDNCASEPCQNGGVCENGVNQYTCHCEPGYTGANCETLVNNCEANPCQNGGACTSNANGYTCGCAVGYTGTNCEINIDDCASEPCHNGGTCIDGVSSYTCSCPPDWGGASCDNNLDSCAQLPCLNGGTCTDGVGIDAYVCTCAAGYSGENCEVDINECAGNPCQHGGLCVDMVDGYACECGPGYTGTNCETFGCQTAYDGTPCDDQNACTTIDSCQAGTCVGGNPIQCPAAPDQCHLDGVCDPAIGGCSIPAKPDGTACSDANACTTGDVCVDGECTAGAPTPCEGTCDPGTGTCTPDGPPIVLGDVTVGNNLQASGSLNLGAPAGANGLVVTVTSGDPTRVRLSTDPGVAGTASVTIAFAPGAQSSATPLYVQALAGTGSVGLVATAPRSASAASTATLGPSGFMFDSGSFTTTTQSPNTMLTVAAVALDPTTMAHIADQAVRGGFAVDVMLANSAPGMGTLTSNPVHFAGGAMTGTTAFDPAEVGSTMLSVMPPAGFATPSDAADVAVTVTGPILNATNPGAIGKNLEASFRVDLAAPAGANGQAITITSGDPTLALVSAGATDVGTGSVTVIVPPNALTSPPVFVQALAGSGQVGLTLSSPGYTPQNKLVPLTGSGFVLLNGNFATTLSAGNTSLGIAPTSLDGEGNPVATQALRPGANAAVSVTSSAPTIGTVTSPVGFEGGDTSRSSTFHPVAVGTTTISIAAPGFGVPRTGTSIVATVSDPTVSVAGDLLNLGKDLEKPADIVLNTNAPAGGLPVTVTSTASSCILISDSATTEGTANKTVTVPAGSNRLTVYVQSLCTQGSFTVSASAPGYRSAATASGTLAFSGFGFPNNSSSQTIPLTLAQNLTVVIAPMALTGDQGGKLGNGQLRGGLTVNVTLASSILNIGTFTPNPVVIQGGDTVGTAVFHPLLLGLTVISIPQQPTGYVRPPASILSFNVNIGL